MSVGSVGGAAGWFNPATSLGGPRASSPQAPVIGQRFGPNDPLNHHLTDADRSAVKSSTGIDFRANGSIMSPMSMSLNDKGAVLDAVGHLAADRANGNSTPLTSSSLAELLGTFGFVGTATDISAAAPTSASQTYAFGHLTKDDHDVLFAATGVRLAADGTVSENTTGKMPDWSLFLQIDMDRAGGRLDGPITETYLQDIAAAHERSDPAFDRSRIDAAVDFLRRRDDARWAEVTASRTAAGL